MKHLQAANHALKNFRELGHVIGQAVALHAIAKAEIWVAEVNALGISQERKQRLLMTLQTWYCGLHACDSFHSALIFAPCSFSCSIPCTFEILHQPDGHKYDGWRMDCLLNRYPISWRHHDVSGLKHITPSAFVQAQLAKRNTDDALNRAAESLRLSVGSGSKVAFCSHMLSLNI